ncbi:MAG: hypothetical protein DRI97_10815 [Bacteroidetes bacterium]|nr:MAG: hypothetical protein DRI97_10815 [Bacteroidota bacterium]
METSILRVKNLKKEYSLGKDNTNLVIPDLNLEIKQGEFVCIMGSSGSGKSTLLYLLGGLDDPSGGEVFVNGHLMPSGQNENALFRRESMGVVFQHNNLIPGLNLLENILVAAFLVQKNRKEARQKAIRLMNELGIGDLQERFPAQVSGGEQQRCSIARALVNDPDILLADEPTGSLNSSSTEKVLEIFAELHSRGQTIVMVTHEIEAACYAEKVVYLRDGIFIDAFNMDRTSDRSKNEKALLGWLTEKGW